MISRRDVGVAGIFALVSAAALGANRKSGQFGQVNRMTAKPGQRAALEAEIVAVAGALRAARPGVLLYQALPDPAEIDILWTVELWPDAETHARAVATPLIKESIYRCRALIARFENLATFDANSAKPLLNSTLAPR